MPSKNSAGSADPLKLNISAAMNSYTYSWPKGLLEENISLRNPIHPAFARENFVGGSDNFYYNITPALQLASLIITDDVCLPLWIRNVLGQQVKVTPAANVVRFYHKKVDECPDTSADPPNLNGYCTWTRSASHPHLPDPLPRRRQNVSRNFFCAQSLLDSLTYLPVVLIRHDHSDQTFPDRARPEMHKMKRPVPTENCLV
jgi:hypothetical protein